MKKGIILIYIMFFAFLLSGCKSTNVIFLSEQDNGSVLKCPVGTVIKISLPENPTTGYQWENVAPKDYVIIFPLQNKFQTPENESEKCGTPGRLEAEFKAVSSGTSSVSFVYRRSWEKDQPPIKRFDILVNVTGKREDHPEKKDDYQFMEYISEDSKK